jgi:hypothetical protein
MILAHIAGMPIEETALSLGPVLAAGGGLASLKLRERFAGRGASRGGGSSASKGPRCRNARRPRGR